jgi:hypothetical protein
VKVADGDKCTSLLHRSKKASSGHNENFTKSQKTKSKGIKEGAYPSRKLKELYYKVRLIAL